MYSPSHHHNPDEQNIVTTNQHPEDLLKVYAIERQDDSTGLVLAFSMATAAFTYMVAAVVFVDSHHPISDIILLAPLVPTAVGCFLALNTAATLLRSVHLQRLEACLHAAVPEANFHTDSGLVWRAGQTAFTKPWQPPRIRVAFAMINLAAYSIVYLGMAGFTAYMIYHAPYAIWKTIAAVLYGIVVTALTFAVVVPLFHPRFQYQPSAEQTCPICGADHMKTAPSESAEQGAIPETPSIAEQKSA